MNPPVVHLRPVNEEHRLRSTSGQDHRGNRLLAALPADALAALQADLKHVALGRGSVIFEPGDPVEQIYFPQTGMISLLIVTRDGDQIETATVGREGAVGLHPGLGARRSLTRATTQIAGFFSTISVAKFRHAVGTSSAALDVISSYTELLWAEAQQIAACNAVHDASSRLCRWLLQSADRINSNELPLTQEFLAQMLGVRRTSVTLLAQALQEKGVIKYTRGMILIIDRRALESLACECYHVLQQERLPITLGVKL